MKRILTALCLFIYSVSSLAFTEADLVTLLQKPTHVQGDFVQRRHLQGLDTPITSKGEFVLVAGQGLLWQMKSPFVNHVRVTPNGIMQWNGSQWVENGKLAQAQQIGLFLGLLSGDIARLKTQFDPEVSGDAAHWELTLTPNSMLMRQIFDRIIIQGDRVVKQIELDEKQGDKTLIVFEHIRENQPLSGFVKSALE